MKRRCFIYLLHFDNPLHHAEHYSGSTESLFRRLRNHATGSGSRLCQVLYARGIHWRLAALAECCHDRMRKLERQLKDQHAGPTYCPLCSGTKAKHLPGTTPYPIEALPFATDSVTLQLQTKNTPIRKTQRLFDPTLREYQRLMELGNPEKDAIGFIPCSGSGGLTKSQIVIATESGKIVGYAAYTGTKTNTTIHQATVEDALRLSGHGRRMIEHVRCTEPTKTTTARVRSDLAANHFWSAIGFDLIGHDVHKTSGSNINIYRAQPISRRLHEDV